MTEREKLLRDIETLRESVRLSFAELGSAYTPGERKNLINHIHILQGELGNLLIQAEKLGTVSQTPPFNVGDRVRHAKFGPGIVTATPIATVGPDPNSLGGTRDVGWRVSVKWDDPERSGFDVIDHVLTPESQPSSQ